MKEINATQSNLLGGGHNVRMGRMGRSNISATCAITDGAQSARGRNRGHYHANKMKRETHNDDEVIIRTTGNRVSPFLQKLPVTKDDERTRAQLPDFAKRRLDADGYQQHLPEESADVIIGSFAAKDTIAARVRIPILINDNSNEDSTIS